MEKKEIKKKIKDPSKKKVCRYCKHNNYPEKFAKHLLVFHSDIMGKMRAIKQLMRDLNNEQLTELLKIVNEWHLKNTTHQNMNQENNTNK